MEFLCAYAALPPRDQGRERIILSICTGALLLGCAQLLRGRKATTHHKALDVLRDACYGAEGNDENPTEVIETRYVDGGFLGNGTRIVTAGGISSGIDASLYVLSLVVGKEMAALAGRIMEFDRSSGLMQAEDN
jgi:transcriptional regulator GlxA family with amidase domain